MIHAARPRPLALLAALALVAGLTVADVHAQEDNQPPEGFRALFNGESLDGFKGRPHFDPYTEAEWSDQERQEQYAEWNENLRQHWTVEDGELVNDGQGVYLTTEEDFRDFELFLDWKITPSADSGIYLRGNPQVQIWDPTDEGQHGNGSDRGSGALWNNQSHERWPLVNADNPPGEWNRMFIRLVDDRVTVVLNGQLVVDNVVMENFFNREGDLFREGPIQFQTHGGEIRFRNVFIRELVDIPAPPTN